MKHFLVITSSAPYGTAQAKEATELALATALFEQKVSLLFQGDGVFQLLPNQNPAAVEQKNLAAMQQALPLYDVEDLFYCADSLQKRGLDHGDLVLSAKALSHSEIASLIRQQDHIFHV
jgi:tRNA 2-thiouridine synthesizing protein C